MKLSILCILTLILGVSFTKINPGSGIPKSVVLGDDSYSASYASIFDLSKGKTPFKFGSNLGLVIDHNTPVQTKHFTLFGVKQLELVKYVSDTLAVFVYDGSKVVIQQLDHNGRYLLKSYFADFNTGLKKQTCTGFAFNEPRNLLYVGCTEKSTQEGPGIMFVATYDLAAEAVMAHEIVQQTDGFRILNRLEIFITTSPQPANEEIYLIAYDQGRQHVSTRKEGNSFRVFRNVATRKLKYYYLGNVELGNRTDLQIVYDFYPFENRLLVTGRYSAAKAGIFLAECEMHNGDKMITCDYNTIKLTGVTEGHVAIINESNYVAVNTDKKTFTVNRIAGDFKDKNWNTQRIDFVEDVQYFNDENSWIRGVSVGEHGATINYDDNVRGQEYGVVFLVYAAQIDLQFKGSSATIWEKNLMFGDNETGAVSLYRLTLAENWVAGFTLKFGANPITLTAADTENSIEAKGEIFLLEDIFEHLEINDMKPITVKAGETGELPITSETIESGNDVSMSAFSTNTDALKIVESYNTQHLDIEWDAEFKGDYFFDGEKAVIEVFNHNSKSMVFNVCNREGIDKVKCSVLQNVMIPSDELVVGKIVDLKAATLAYSFNRNTLKSRVVIATKDEAYSHFFKKEIVAIQALNHLTKYLVIIAFTNEVEVYEVNINDIEDWKLHTTLNAESYGVRNFCPVSVSHPLPAGNLIWDILSHCKTRSTFTSVSSVFRYAYLSSSNSHELPLSNLDVPTSVCSFGVEVFVSTNVRAYGVSIHDRFAHASVPIKDLNIDLHNFKVDCVDGAGAAVIYGSPQGQQSGLIKNAWVIRGGSGARQDKRYPVNFLAFGDAMKSFSFFGGIITVIEKGGVMNFVETLLDPVVHFEAKAVTKETDVEVQLTIKNHLQTAHGTIIVTVVPDTQAEVESEEMKRLFM